MFYEFAIEPEVFASPARMRFFFETLGASQGRFVANYPRRWDAMVKKAMDGLPDVAKKKAFERLHRLTSRGLSARRGQYNGHVSWIENAREEHGRSAFRAIVTLSPDERNDRELSGEDVEGTNPYWQVDQDKFIERDPVLIAKAIAPLLHASNRIIIVDPYFRADQSSKLTAVRAIFRQVSVRPAPIEIHYLESENTEGQIKCEKYARQALPLAIPKGIELQLQCWREKPGGKEFHNRYLFTNVGGVTLGHGFERGAPGQTDHLAILSEGVRFDLWRQYVEANGAFEAVGGPLVLHGEAAL